MSMRSSGTDKSGLGTIRGTITTEFDKIQMT